MSNSTIPFDRLPNTQLNQALSTNPYFIGVYPRDRLPKTLDLCRRQRPPLTLIVNTDTCNLSGRHWVAAYIDQSGHAEYFDSLAQPIPYHISLWLTRFAAQWTYVLHPFIDPPIQNMSSQTCGAFTFYFVHRRPLLNSCRAVLSPFRSSHSNDQFVITYLNKMLIEKAHVFI